MRRPKAECRAHEGKRRFRDKPQAVGALHTISSRGEVREKTPIRVYECESCKGWFLTSRPNR